MPVHDLPAAWTAIEDADGPAPTYAVDDQPRIRYERGSPDAWVAVARRDPDGRSREAVQYIVTAGIGEGWKTKQVVGGEEFDGPDDAFGVARQLAESFVHRFERTYSGTGDVDEAARAARNAVDRGRSSR